MIVKDNENVLRSFSSQSSRTNSSTTTLHSACGDDSLENEHLFSGSKSHPPVYIKIAPEKVQTAESVLKEIRDNQVGWSTDDKEDNVRVRRKLYEGSYPNSSVVDEGKLPTVVRLAWKGKYEKLVKYFRKSGRIHKVNRQDDQGRTALHFAASWGDTKIIKLLLSIPGIKLDIKDRSDMTPLFKAVQINSLAAVKLLVEGGAKPTIPCRDGRDLIDYTLMQYGDCCINILEYLMTDVRFKKQQVKNHMTYLHMATLVKRQVPIYQTVEFLMNQGYDIDALEGNGRTPLILAAMADRADIVYPLLRNFADVKVYDNFTKDAFRYAKVGSMCYDLLKRCPDNVSTRALHPVYTTTPTMACNTNEPFNINPRINTDPEYKAKVARLFLASKYKLM